MPTITEVLLEPPAQPVPGKTEQAAEDGWWGKLLYAGVNLVLNDYYAHYDQRLALYNQGRLSYDQFANANFTELMGTIMATTVSMEAAARSAYGASTAARWRPAGRPGRGWGDGRGGVRDGGGERADQGQPDDRRAVGQSGYSLEQILTSGAIGGRCRWRWPGCSS
ncbi:hypothetical protein [Chitinimonas koreensis]|uniref:hypothetical protein n=1 Tax=Chitinimonas koreensis TaxID=356302 RepID=UPI0016547BAC|nr:hypothetical protein [Chitinimonas koreensis]QNM98757.1 hypothetical protein H9L41_11390 [Chitinimonas koreensis]